MFTQLQPGSHREIKSQLVSIATHGLLLFLLLRPPHAIFVRPSGLAAGGRGRATELVYVSQSGNEDAIRPPRAAKHQPATPKPPVPASRRTQEAVLAPPREQATESTVPSAAAGSPLGSQAYGPTTGHEVRPALPVVFPDPVVSRSEIPAGVVGDVVVEVTIDAQGNVTETKVLQPFGYGIEDKVLAVLRNWRFRPATMDGVPIPSQQDVYFHFPS
ncbi:MAG: energy transducer TonB [Acidobacteriia bacterium]|nr:energy transducer TonB [Terriglobia bacterium]